MDGIKHKHLLMIILILMVPSVYAGTVHEDYDWEGDDSDEQDPPSSVEYCYACHGFEHMEPGGYTRNCEDCHLSGGAGPVSEGVDPSHGYLLRGDYTAPLIYSHYYGASVNVPDQSSKYGGTTIPSCFGFNPATGQGTCHGVSNSSAVDGKYAFEDTNTDLKCMPYREATSLSFPETSDCLYCHLQEDSSVVEAWANPNQVTNHENATTNGDCYSCHVDGGSAPQSFHAVSLKLTTGEGAPAGGGTAVTPPTLLQEGINMLTADLYRRIILDLGLRYKPFFKSPDTLVAPLIMTGKYPTPTDPDATRTLGNPIEDISGDVYELAASHSMQRYSHVNALVIARGDLPVDSMAAIAYAKANGVPILLVKPEDVPEVTLGAISKLGPEEIIIVGGPVAVSKAVEDKLTAKANVKRIYGETRVETAVELAKEIQPDTIVITDSINPSTDATLISYLFDAPLLYVNSSEISGPVRDYLSQHKTAPGGGKTKVVVVGVGSELTHEIEEIVR